MNLYPLHDKREKIDPKNPKSELHRTCASPMILPEQSGRVASGDNLFCLGCAMIVLGEKGQRQQAEAAARSEGWTLSVKGPATAGSISDEARKGLYWALKVANRQVRDEQLGEALKIISEGAADMCVAGLYEINSSSLTPAGVELARKIVSPEVPPLPPPDPKWAAAHRVELKRADAKARKSRRVKERVETPMLCVCGHGPRLHLNHAGSDVPCTVPGVKCGGYRQAKVKKPAKLKKAKPEAVAVPA